MGGGVVTGGVVVPRVQDRVRVEGLTCLQRVTDVDWPNRRVKVALAPEEMVEGPGREAQQTCPGDWWADWNTVTVVTPEAVTQKDAAMRHFSSGATRDTATGKPDYSGFNSSLVEQAFGQYMLKHQVQADGQPRAADNWKNGIPKEAYRASLHRHFMDLWLHSEGYGDRATNQDLVEVLCALRFNVNGLLLEVVKEGRV